MSKVYDNLSNFEGDNSCFDDVIYSYLQSAFDKAVIELDVEYVFIRSILKPDYNPKNDSDFYIYLPQCVYPRLCANLDAVCNLVKAGSSEIFRDCSPLGDHKIQFFLNRTEVYRRVLKRILRDQGVHPPKCNGKNVLIYVHDKKAESLTNYRSLLITEHVMSILLADGYTMHCQKSLWKDFWSDRYSDSVKLYDCECDMGTIHSEWLEKCENLTCKKVENTGHDADGFLTLDATDYLETRDSHDRFYDGSISLIRIRKNDFTDSFRKSAHLHHVLESHVKNIHTIIHVLPVHKRISAQKCGVLLEMCTNRKFDQLFLTCQTATSKQHPDLTEKEYIDSVRKGVEVSLTSKYGKDVIDDEVWIKRLNLLSDTIIKFDFLMTSFSSPLNLYSYNSGTSFQDKGGAFVQYNCARLTVIFNRYEEGVKSGYYQELPSIDDIDFALLKQQDEWNLFSKYILPYSKIVRDLSHDVSCGNSVEISMTTHRLCRMLVNLSRDLSLYYNKSKVLAEPVPRLIPKMNAKLYFLKAIYHVMKNSLALLNLSVVERM